MSIRVLIVDDEPLARRSLLRHLCAHPDMQVIGECGNGRSAVGAIQAGRPDLVFLDVQMPEMDGFQLVERIGPERMPVVIFVTAYDRYALKAFEVDALDYLLKPFRKERFERALARARERIEARRAESQAGRSEYLDRIPVSGHGRVRFVKVQDIDWIEGAGNYAVLHAGKLTHEIRETLANVEGKLDPKRFVRVHRSAIVNADRIREVHPWFHGYHLLVLESGDEVRMSRYQRESAGRLGLRRGSAIP